MKFRNTLTIAAATVATIVVSIALPSCQGRRMDNMVPTGETVKVVIAEPAVADTITPPASEIL